MAGDRTFTATSRSNLVSRALYTSPMPPAPSAASTSYGPSRAPGDKLRGMRHCRAYAARGGREGFGYATPAFGDPLQPRRGPVSDLIFYAIAIVVMWLSFRMLKWNHRQKAARRAPERLAEAAQRGWTYEQEQTTVFEIERWRGSTDGIEWVSEAARTGTRRSRLDGAALKGSATLITRWHTMRRMPVSGPVL